MDVLVDAGSWLTSHDVSPEKRDIAMSFVATLPEGVDEKTLNAKLSLLFNVESLLDNAFANGFNPFNDSDTDIAIDMLCFAPSLCRETVDTLTPCIAAWRVAWDGPSA